MPGTRGWFCRRRRTRANDPHAADRVRGLPVGRSGIAAGRGAAAEREGGSALFAPPTGPADLNNPASWWRYRKGADWLPHLRHAQPAGKTITGIACLNGAGLARIPADHVRSFKQSRIVLQIICNIEVYRQHAFVDMESSKGFTLGHGTHLAF